MKKSDVNKKLTIQSKYTVTYTNQFKQDYVKCFESRKNLDMIDNAIKTLAVSGTL